MGLLCIPFLLLPSKLLKYPAKVWIGVIFLFLDKICNIRHRIEGLENVPQYSVLVVSKHQSTFETFAFYYYLTDCFFVHKRELFIIPIFGQYLLKANMVAINRDGRTKTMRKMLEDVKARLQKGKSIIIFPEGTRKEPGSNPDYKSGFIGIYKNTKKKILPVALNSGLCWSKKSWILKSGDITIKFLPIIEENLNKVEILQKVQDSIETESNKLLIN
ncbi:1-acyl-sn-glycerol-3-phosphate acyltransferase [Pelagibacteraceae bacterium]|nr:1-acyl-sn-glycerol-3-phosphate acyltransferase [Pelagibacteraceae bacterium]